LGEALERGLLGPVAGPTAGGDSRVRVRPAPRSDRGAGGDVDDGPGAPRDHVREHELAQDEGRVEVDRPRAEPLADRVVLDRHVVGERRVVHQHVDRAVAPRISRSHSAGSEMLAPMPCASPPASRMAATVLSSEPAKGCWPSWTVRATQITRPPSDAKSRAMSAPMPRLAPVTTTIFPSSRPMGTSGPLLSTT